MDDVLAALGWRARSYDRARLVGYIVLLSTVFTVGGYLVAAPLGRAMWIVELLLWVPWLAWLGYFFPRAHTGALASGAALPYRKGFFLQVAPGISWNFAQMARPALAGAVLGFGEVRAVPAVIGVGIAAVGGVMIALALRAIGVCRALFLGEYHPPTRQLVTGSIYGLMRHPLFVGGLIVSIGSGVFFFSWIPLSMAAANVAVLPFYRRLEDSRCTRVHEAYERYRRDVRGVVPAMGSASRLRARSRSA
jgi:protein-S-isoprenylcysteine O-methyltransferase Ste14